MEDSMTYYKIKSKTEVNEDGQPLYWSQFGSDKGWVNFELADTFTHDEKHSAILEVPEGGFWVEVREVAVA
jgi:hypothetical protein